MIQNPQDQSLLTLSALAQLEADVRKAQNATALAFQAVNETHRLTPYEQAVAWRFGASGGAKVTAVSGVVDLDRNAPYVVWVRAAIKHFCRQDNARRMYVIDPALLPDKLKTGWAEWAPGSVLWCPWIGPDEELLGGLWLSREQPWQEGEITLLQRLVEAQGFALAFHALKERHALRRRIARWLPNRTVKWLLMALPVAIAFLPVRLSVLAPADVVPRESLVVSAPVEGVIKEIHVRPNADVAAGQVLFSLDDTTFASRHEVASKALEVVRAEHLRAQQKAFNDVNSKAELARLNAVVQEKIAEVEHTARLLERIHVRAERDGIVLFNDPNDWVGKPIAVGEKVMVLADQDRTDVQACVPVGDAINLAEGAEVQVFLNTDPTRPLSATLYQSSFEAELTPNEVLAFRVKAEFEDEVNPRIGLKGTAKIYGEKVSVAYYVMRKPLAAFRQFFGL